MSKQTNDTIVLYKLVNNDYTSKIKGPRKKKWKWDVGVTHQITKPGVRLCTDQVIHAYDSIEKAFIYNNLHGKYRDFKVMIGCGAPVAYDSKKVGVKRLTISGDVTFDAFWHMIDFLRVMSKEQMEVLYGEMEFTLYTIVNQSMFGNVNFYLYLDSLEHKDALKQLKIIFGVMPKNNLSELLEKVTKILHDEDKFFVVPLYDNMCLLRANRLIKTALTRKLKYMRTGK